MNGAMTDPLVNTTSAPTTINMTHIGNSQNFRLAIRNRQSSTIKSTHCLLELILQRLGRWTRRMARDPIGVSAPLGRFQL